MPTRRNNAPVVSPCESIVNRPPEIPGCVSANMPSTTNAEVRDRRVGDDPLQVRLHRRDDGAVGDADHREHEQDRREVDRGLREHRDREPQEAVGAHLEHHAGQHDRTGGRRVGVRVGQPRVERDQRDLHREADGERDEQPLRRWSTDKLCADEAHAVSTRTSKVRWPVACWCRNATDRIPTNRNAEPVAVYR